MAKDGMTPEELKAAMAQLRDAAEAAVREPGQRRIRLVGELEAADAELRPLVVDAIRAGVPHRRIAVMTALAPNTVRDWAKRAEQERNDN